MGTREQKKSDSMADAAIDEYWKKNRGYLDVHQ
jgi:hypothetical protein